ncbi:hypothetical protein GFH48_14745 [Streptomyces fagopyri]|uniref:ATP-grasp domain-containing protein n=1 Tax=Streptomyces fagopyri TaxID=2662397 RepID=A0A5Q0LBC2_9ACTN|nr:hypothetical protein [Streptomyces fagopyri]QFZ74345.1 hypothetical protein GFH48_14745 [Streptomyces fagopyri]
MPSARSSLLYVSDLAYPAKGRRYGDEDVFLTSRLREDFDVAVCHPLDAVALMAGFDAVVVRNSGPVLGYRAEYDAFRQRALADRVRVYNQLSGKGDMAGKQYLLDLTAAGFPVIPTVDRARDLHRLPDVDTYVVKPKLGADSIGLEFVPRDRLAGLSYDDRLVQPRVDFRYEVSFYFVDRAFQYALYAPRPDRRWDLEPYEATERDREFAQRFVDWNDIAYGVQRVDACRAPDGELLLVELEDLNPYLSLDVLSPAARDSFVARMKESLRGLLGQETVRGAAGTV